MGKELKKALKEQNRRIAYQRRDIQSLHLKVSRTNRKLEHKSLFKIEVANLHVLEEAARKVAAEHEHIVAAKHKEAFGKFVESAKTCMWKFMWDDFKLIKN